MFSLPYSTVYHCLKLLSPTLGRNLVFFRHCVCSIVLSSVQPHFHVYFHKLPSYENPQLFVILLGRMARTQAAMSLSHLTFSSNRPTGPIRSTSRDVCVFVCCLSPFHLLDFEDYFAPTSRSRMSKNFRDSESSGKSAGKKWSQN